MNYGQSYTLALFIVKWICSDSSVTFHVRQFNRTLSWRIFIVKYWFHFKLFIETLKYDWIPFHTNGYVTRVNIFILLNSPTYTKGGLNRVLALDIASFNRWSINRQVFNSDGGPFSGKKFHSNYGLNRNENAIRVSSTCFDVKYHAFEIDARRACAVERIHTTGLQTSRVWLNGNYHSFSYMICSFANIFLPKMTVQSKQSEYKSLEQILICMNLIVCLRVDD